MSSSFERHCHRALAVFDRAAEVFAAVLVVALVVSVTLGIVTRAMDDPLDWTDELARMQMVWLAMLGWIISSRRRGHVRIRFVQDLLPAPLRRATEVAIQLALIGLGTVVAGYGVQLIGRNLDLDATSLPISIAWMYVPLVPAGVVTALQAGAEAAAQLRRVRPPA